MVWQVEEMAWDSNKFYWAEAVIIKGDRNSFRRNYFGGNGGSFSMAIVHV